MTSTQDPFAIEAVGLAKCYGPVHAVSDVSLRVRPGEIYGFLGRNGAGKTTTIRMLLGLVRPTAGAVSIFGIPLRDDRTRALSPVGCLVETAAAYPNLTVQENLDLQRRLTGAPASSVEQVILRLGLEEYRARRAGRLSLGNKQRLSLARAMLHSPRLLILDEPANGLDPAGIVEIRGLLRGLADRDGVTIFLSSHQLDQVEHLADRVGIVHAGRLVEEVDARRLSEAGRLGTEVEVDDLPRAERVLRDGLGLTRLSRAGERSLVVTDPGAEAAGIARALVQAGISLLRLAPMEETLEQHFMRLTGGEGGEA